MDCVVEDYCGLCRRFVDKLLLLLCGWSAGYYYVCYYCGLLWIASSRITVNVLLQCITVDYCGLRRRGLRWIIFPPHLGGFFFLVFELPVQVLVDSVALTLLIDLVLEFVPWWFYTLSVGTPWLSQC